MYVLAEISTWVIVDILITVIFSLISFYLGIVFVIMMQFPPPVGGTILKIKDVPANPNFLK